MYIRRNSEPTLLDVSRSFPCVVVYGPRQVGKSTTVDYLFGDRCRKATLDDLDDRTLANQNPKLFLERYGWPLIIDEIQKAPRLLDEIKRIVDAQRLLWLKENKPRELMYVLTGSNRFELQEGVSESLAGRCGVFELSSLSQSEKYGAEGKLFQPEMETALERERELPNAYRTRARVFEDIFLGGMPDVVTGESQRDAYFKSYVNTYLEKDVRKLIAAGSESAFRNFLSILALRTAQELRYDSLASNVGIDVKTCKRWISILETSGLIFLLQPYLANVSNRIIKAPKLYFMDTGLCSFLCKWPNAEMLESGAMGGAFFETYVVAELIRNFQVHNLDPRESLFYYRDIDQKEIDLLYVRRDVVYPIEIKKSAAPVKPTKNFRVLEKFHMKIGTGLVVDTCDKIRPVNELAYFYPVSLLGM